MKKHEYSIELQCVILFYKKAHKSILLKQSQYSSNTYITEKFQVLCET